MPEQLQQVVAGADQGPQDPSGPPRQIWADYESGSGTAELIFAYRVAQLNHSPRASR